MANAMKPRRPRQAKLQTVDSRTSGLNQEAMLALSEFTERVRLYAEHRFNDTTNTYFWSDDVEKVIAAARAALPWLPDGLHDGVLEALTLADVADHIMVDLNFGEGADYATEQTHKICALAIIHACFPLAPRDKSEDQIKRENAKRERLEREKAEAEAAKGE